MRKNVGTDNPVMTKILHMPDGQLRFTKCLHDFKKQEIESLRYIHKQCAKCGARFVDERR